MALKNTPVKAGKPEIAEVKQCTCQNAGQDELYGKGNRLHNQTKSGSYRCSVCGIGEKGKK